MIVGSGLLATSFSPLFVNSEDVMIYAAGVSNSSCTDRKEFERERSRLSASLDAHASVGKFVYFSTCSLVDPELSDKPYASHKRAMEDLVRRHARHLILRLPQLAGRSINPHTLLNYLHARISRSERFSIWGRATRNIIDVDDVVRIGCHLIDDENVSRDTLNIANSTSYAVQDIVSTFERVCRKKAIYDIVEKGACCPIDVRRIAPILAEAGVDFSPAYLWNVLQKYYG